MAAETIVEIYRTKEDRDNFIFKAAVTISYFGCVAFIQGLSGSVDIDDFREIKEYLLSKPHIEKCQYYRKGRLKEIHRQKPS